MGGQPTPSNMAAGLLPPCCASAAERGRTRGVLRPALTKHSTLGLSALVSSTGVAPSIEDAYKFNATSSDTSNNELKFLLIQGWQHYLS